jgi:hypothetical protein
MQRSVLGPRVLITTDPDLSWGGMDVLVIFRLEEILGLPSRNIEGKPTLIIRMNNCTVLDARYDEPITHSLDRFLGRGK